MIEHYFVLMERDWDVDYLAKIVWPTYIVLVRTRIGCPKNAGTFSSISECVLMKFNVASGSVFESL